MYLVMFDPHDRVSAFERLNGNRYSIFEIYYDDREYEWLDRAMKSFHPDRYWCRLDLKPIGLETNKQ